MGARREKLGEREREMVEGRREEGRKEFKSELELHDFGSSDQKAEKRARQASFPCSLEKEKDFKKRGSIRR